MFSSALCLTSHIPPCFPILPVPTGPLPTLGLRVHALLAFKGPSFPGMACETGLWRQERQLWTEAKPGKPGISKEVKAGFAFYERPGFQLMIYLKQLYSSKHSWESLGLQGDPNQSILKETSPGCLLEGLMLRLKLHTLSTSCEELTHWKRPWCWEGLRAGGEGDDRGWDGWMASLTQWTWIWVNSGSWWWTSRPGVLRFMGLQSWTWLSDWTEAFYSQHIVRKKL